MKMINTLPIQDIPGIAIVLIKEGKISRQIISGLKNIDMGLPVTDTTIFEAASLSKPVFAYTIMQLLEQGVLMLDLDIPLVEYLPYPDVKQQDQLKFITARMTLAHTTGFPNWRAPGETLNIQFSPGSQFGYSGEGYLYLQKVVEYLTSTSIEALANTVTFQPLRMNYSSFLWPTDWTTRGYDRVGHLVQTCVETKPNAAFSLHTTASDFAAIVIASMTGIGKQMTALQTPINDTVNWGLGWGLQHTEIGDSFWQWGDNRGFHSYAAGFPANRSGIVIMTNSEKGLSFFPDLVLKLTGVRHPSFIWLKNHYEKNKFTY